MKARPLSTCPLGVRVLLLSESTTIATGPVVGVARSVFDEDEEEPRTTFDVVHYNGMPFVRDFRPTGWAPLEPLVQVRPVWNPSGSCSGWRILVNDKPLIIYANRDTADYEAQQLAHALGTEVTK